jgi:arylformamidase
MTYIDVTRPLAKDMLVYVGDLHPEFRQEDRGLYLISDLNMSTHSGTHIDAPVHYLKTGQTIDQVPFENLIGRCRVIDVSSAGNLITGTHIQNKITGVERLLLKTAFSGKNQFTENYPSLSLDAARLIAMKHMRCVGIDSLSIESFDCDGSVHRELSEHGMSIIELLDLSQVTEGDYEMIALPLRLAGLDGSPARVLLRPLSGCE